jgi:hypothetical protein
MVNQLNSSHRTHAIGSQQLLSSIAKIEASATAQQQSLKQLGSAIERLRRAAV